MKRHVVSFICFTACVALLAAPGCGKEPGPPPPLSVEAIPGEMQKVFNTAEPEAKDTVGRLTLALQSKDYPAAYQEVQTLCGLRGETKEQRALSARALLTITGLLQSAQAQGDQNATAALKLRQMTR